jgi:hypothetical protein
VVIAYEPKWHTHQVHRPQTREELFNLRHSQLRNVVERIFGVAKKRFLVIAQGTRFDTEKQSRVQLAFAAIFNFLVMHDPNNTDFNFDPGASDELVWRNFDTATGLMSNNIGDEGEIPGAPSTQETREAEAWRDGIAQDMWDQYVEYQSRHT